MNNQTSIIEAVVFAAGKGITKNEILEKLQITPARLDKICAELKQKYSKENGGIMFCVTGDTLHFVTAPDVGEQVAEVLKPLKERELSRSLLEVMAIVAYKQPVTRLEIDDIRSANSDYAIGMLLKSNLIEVVGRKDAVGRPLLYGTTQDFLVKFQLSDLSELPSVKEVQERIKVIESEMPRSAELFPEKAVNEVDAPMLAVGEEIDVDKFSQSGDEYEVDLSEVQLEVAADTTSDQD